MTRLLKVLMLAVLTWAIAASALAAQYYMLYAEEVALRRSLEARCSKYELMLQNMTSKYEALSSRLIKVSIAIDYGNGTVKWYNDTVLPIRSTVFSALLSIANVTYKTSQMGVYVTGINGVKEEVHGSWGRSWVWYMFNREKGEWEWGMVAADRQPLTDGDMVMWQYFRWGG